MDDPVSCDHAASPIGSGRLMSKLTHYRLCPHSRAIRLAAGELGLAVELSEESPWDWRPEFLELNPSGDLPVLEIGGGPKLAGAYAISEYLAETHKGDPEEAPRMALFPGTPEERAEVRRLVDWFQGKMHREVTRELLEEKLYARLRQQPAAGPDAAILRAIRANLRYHLSYIGHLTGQRRWLGGEEMSFADLAAAAHLSVIDYLGEVPWEDFRDAKSWYARVKSRPAFRPLLTDRVPGMTPPAVYADLDF